MSRREAREKDFCAKAGRGSCGHRAWSRAPEAPGGIGGAPTARMVLSSSDNHCDRVSLLLAVSSQCTHTWASVNEDERRDCTITAVFFCLFVSSKQELMAYLEMRDFLGIQVAQDLLVYLATQACLAKR